MTAPQDLSPPQPADISRSGAPAARYYIGLGARRGVAATDVVALVSRVAQAHGVDMRDVTLCTVDSKATETGFHEAARQLGVALLFLPLDALRARKGAAPTHSPRVQAMFGVGSVAEAAALVAAGPGSRLMAPRTATPVAACAIARQAA